MIVRIEAIASSFPASLTCDGCPNEDRQAEPASTAITANADRDKLGDNVNRKQEMEFKEERKQEDRRVPSLCGLVMPLGGFKFITNTNTGVSRRRLPDMFRSGASP